MLSTVVTGIPASELYVIKPKTKRLTSIDLLRGIVMIIMALDHVRDYFHKDAFYYSPTDLSQTSAFLFFTRFITHYCAPVFVFLAGTSAYLSGQKKSRKELSRFLFTRGLWLVLVEIIILDLFRTFNPAFTYINLQVIWAIGLCMMAMAALIYLDLRVIIAIGIVLVGAHNLLDAVHVPGHDWVGISWMVLHDVGHFAVGGAEVYIRYPVLPWIGVMALGYGAGRLYSPAFHWRQRRKLLLAMGVGAIGLFVVLRSGNFYGDASHWTNQHDMLRNVLSFLNVSKYPPSLLYILITLGPALIFLSFAERMQGVWQKPLTIIGKVPMFYYLAHILLIHLLALGGAFICGYDLHTMVLSRAVNETQSLKGYGFNLLAVYVIWIALVLALYPMCKWFARYKSANSEHYWWLSYL